MSETKDIKTMQDLYDKRDTTGDTAFQVELGDLSCTLDLKGSGCAGIATDDVEFSGGAYRGKNGK
jgi:hypothetical protein